MERETLQAGGEGKGKKTFAEQTEKWIEKAFISSLSSF